ncbi:MAG: hypothetical protein AB7O67_16570 [Vicinamibacterales bacterium]
MALADIIRSGISTARGAVAGVMSTVSHAAHSGEDAYRKPTYAAAVSRQAIVEDDVRLVTTDDGREVLTQTRITFLDNVTVTTKDAITLPDGSTGPIVKVAGMHDPAGGRFLVRVWLGAEA